MRKPRILFCSEASYTNSGFATYYHEVMRRLHATGKYELAELAAYGDTSDPGDQRWRDIPWKFFPVKPDRNNPEECRQYDSATLNQFGEWKFEQTCIDFRPDIVCDIRDWWMLEFAERSPFRQHFHWAIMPTVDAAPQEEQWLATFANADAVFSYSDWGLDLLREQAGGSINLKTTASPGADLDVYKPVPDREAHRREMGFNEDCLIVGTVMRNQRRKLYPDLVQAFAQFLKEAPAELANKTFLYLHTAWPDLGWDIPKLIKEAGIGHKTVMTYFCRACGGVFPSFFADAKTHCIRCGAYEAGFPNSNSGISREVLCNVLNMFDVYVQYANSEGFGMPLVEAAACGIPVMAVDYSAMSDVVRKLKGMPIDMQRLYRESETHCWRALPDNSDFVRKLINLLSKPEPVQARHRREARQQVEKFYTYEKTAKVWEDHFDSVVLRDEQTTWLSPAQSHEPRNGIPRGLSDEEFVRWGLIHVAGRPDLVNSYTALRMIRDLGWGLTNPHMGAMYFNESSTIGMTERNEPFNREIALQRMLDLCSQRNHWEKERTK